MISLNLYSLDVIFSYKLNGGGGGAGCRGSINPNEQEKYERNLSLVRPTVIERRKVIK